MAKVRTRADEARFFLARQRDALLRSGREVPSRKQLLDMNLPHFDDVLVALSNDDIRNIADEDAIMIHDHDHDQGLDGRVMTGDTLFAALPGWTSSDVFLVKLLMTAAKIPTRVQ